MRPSARAAVVAGALALVAVPFTVLLALVQAGWGPLADLDAAVRDDLHTFAVAHPWFVDAMRAVSFAGSARVYAVVFSAIAAWLLLGARSPRRALFVVVAVGGTGIVNRLAKAAVDRARPVVDHPVEIVTGTSFPSGHAQSSVVIGGTLLVVFLPLLRGPARTAAIAGAVAFALLVGFSRVALGVHFVSDVLAGWVLGAAWVGLVAAAFAAWRR